MVSTYLSYIRFCVFMENIGFFSNVIFGGTLIYLTIFHIKRQFGSYKNLLVNFQILGFFFASLEYVFHTVLHNYNASLTWISLSRPLGLPNYAIEWAMACYAGLYCATISQLAVQFVYRYWALFTPKRVKLFEGKNYLIWISYYTILGTLWACAVRHFYGIDEFGIQYLSEEILTRFERNISEIPVLAMIAYQGNNIRWRNAYGVLTMTLIFTVQYSIISFCCHQMFIYMRAKISLLSAQHRRLHRQFFRALLIQITAPTIILFSPVFFMIYAPFADLQMSFPSCIIQSGFTVYPALDSIIMMSCVSEYGRSFKKTFLNVKNKCLMNSSKEKSRDSVKTSTLNMSVVTT